MDKYHLVDLQAFAFIINLILAISVFAKKKESSYSSLFFILICFSSMLMLILDSLGWVFDGIEGPGNRGLLTFVDSLFYAVQPLPTLLWLNYVEFNLTGSFSTLKKKGFYLFPLVLSVGLVLVSQFNGIVFTLDDQNIYHRGIGVYAITLIDWLCVIYTLIMAFRYRNRVEYRITGFIVFLTLIPLTGSLIQLSHYGVSLVLPFSTLTLIGSYFFLEIRKESRDPLTGLMNRQQLDQWIEYRINQYSRSGPFFFIIVDINQFKNINDSYGHTMGDKALTALASLFLGSIKKTDKLARFGGDEFVIVLETGDINELHQVLWSFQSELDNFNLTHSDPFILSYSYGYALFHPEEIRGMTDLFRKAEQMMYTAKARKKHPFKRAK